MAEVVFPLPTGTIFGGVEEILTEQKWSQLAPLTGSDVSWSLYGPHAPTAVTGRTVTSVPAISAQAGGFWASIPSFQATHPAISSGSRWDFLGVRLDWTPSAAEGGGRVMGVVITGGSSAVLPSSRQTTLGSKFDIPVSLSLVDASIGAVRSIVPLYRSETKVAQVASLLAIPTPHLGQTAWVGQSMWRFDGSRWVDATPATKVYSDTITAYTSTVVAANPKSGRLLAQIVVPDPGYPYSIMTSGQVELDPITRTEVYTQYGPTTTGPWTQLRPQFFTTRGTGETKTLTTQAIAARTGQTVIHLLSRVRDIDYKTGATYSVSAYNGAFQAIVLPR